MSSFTKLSNGNVIFTDNDGHEAKLSPTLNVLPNPENEYEIIITPFARFTSWSSIDMVVDWREIQSPIVESRNDAIEKLALNFFFNVTQGEEQHSHSNLDILEKISEIDGELAYNGLKFGQVGNVIFVSASNGNNETGKRGSINFPFSSLYSAFLVAEPGDLIYVLPGTYNDEGYGILKDQVDFYFSPSTFVISNGSIFDDSYSTEGVTSNIFGYGNFQAARPYVVHIRKQSKIFLECFSIESAYNGYGPIYVGSNLASIKIVCETIIGPRPIFIDKCLDAYITCRNIVVNNSTSTTSYAVFTSELNTGIVYIETDIIQGDNVYGSNVINHLNGTLNIRCKSITDENTSGYIIFHGAGKLSFTGNITAKGKYIYHQKANTSPGKVVLNGTFIADTVYCIAYLLNTTDIDFLGKFYLENGEALISTTNKINQKVYCEGFFENKSLTGNVFYNNQATTQIVFSKCTLKAVAKIINSTVSITIKVIDFISLSKAFESNISVLSDYITLIPGFQLPVMPSIKHGKIVVNDSADKQNTVVSFGGSFATSNYTLIFRVYDASQEYIVDEVSRNTTGFVIDLSTITFTSLTVEFFAAL